VLRSRILVLVMTIAAYASPSWAAHSPELNQKLCEQMLGVTLISAEPGQVPEFDLMAGLGMRGFLGAYPEATGANAAHLASQGVMYWGHSFAVKKTLAEAEAHDAQFQGLAKIMYLISDVDVADLNDETPDEIVRERFRQIFAESQMVYWDDSEAIISKSAVPAKFVQVDMNVARRLILPETVGYFTLDERGPRFTQSGWVFPKIRGELNYDAIFNSGSGTIKKVLKEARALSAKGYTFTFNQNFEEALNAARDQIRLETNESGVKVKVPANSRYREPEVYNKALEAYRAGHALSVEVRDPEGRLIAGILGERHGNIIALETIFYGYVERPDGSFRSNLDEAKMAVLAALQRFHEHGINVADAGMVTPFTASLKGEYVAAAKFAADIEELRRRETIAIDFSRGWIP